MLTVQLEEGLAEPADHLGAAEIGDPEPVRHHAAQGAGLDERDPRALPRGRIGCHDAGRRAAVDHDVVDRRGGEREPRAQRDGREAEENGTA